MLIKYWYVVISFMLLFFVTINNVHGQVETNSDTTFTYYVDYNGIYNEEIRAVEGSIVWDSLLFDFVEFNAASHFFDTGHLVLTNENGVDSGVLNFATAGVNPLKMLSTLSGDSTMGNITLRTKNILSDFDVVGTFKFNEISQPTIVTKSGTIVSPIPNEKPVYTKSGSVTIFPNPVLNNIVNLDIQIPNPEVITIILYDNLGREVLNLYNGVLVNTNRLHFNVDTLSPGMYILRVIGNTTKIVKSVVVV